jgi:hypothetical protein
MDQAWIFGSVWCELWQSLGKLIFLHVRLRLVNTNRLNNVNILDAGQARRIAFLSAGKYEYYSCVDRL